jgi:cell division protease FtsH
MGAANITTAGASDLDQAVSLARDMIFKCGWSPTLGPINIADENEDFLSGQHDTRLGDMTPQMAGAAMLEIQQMMKAAEAKAYFGLVCNWELLQAMVDHLMESPSHTLSRYAPYVAKAEY